MASHEPVPRQEEDLVRTGRVVFIGLGALAIFAVGVLTASWEQAALQQGGIQDAYSSIPPQVGQEQVGIVFQRTFDETAKTDGLARHRRQESQLESYGWIDQSQGRIRIPIDRAMESYLAGARP